MCTHLVNNMHHCHMIVDSWMDIADFVYSYSMLGYNTVNQWHRCLDFLRNMYDPDICFCIVVLL
jgi:hypothetical protein